MGNTHSSCFWWRLGFVLRSAKLLAAILRWLPRSNFPFPFIHRVGQGSNGDWAPNIRTFWKIWWQRWHHIPFSYIGIQWRRKVLGAPGSWASQMPRAAHSLWKSNLTSSLVWHCRTKCPNQRVLFSISVTPWVLGSKYETNAATIPVSRPLEK